jgi:multidrug efflux pump subunit AcrA (membrane-fusion protein)
LELQASLFQRETALTIAKAKWRGLGLEGSDFDRMVADPDVPTSVRLSLKSPISGTILHTDLTVGKFVNLKEHVLEVIDLSRLWLRIDILEKDVSRIQVGDPVEFFPTSGLGKPIAGSLGVIEKSLDPVTHLATAWVDLPMDTSQIASLLPGMTGQVKIGAQSTAARLSIPKSALVRDGAERFVLVEQERNEKASVFRKIPLAIGEQSGGICEVTRGELVPGDRVLTQGSRQLGHLFTQGVLKLSPEAAVDIGFKTQKVEPLRVSRTLSVDGVVSLPPSKLARVSSQLSGRVHQILIDRSATVRQGQALALLSSPEFQDLQLDCIQAYLEMRFRESVLRNIRQGGTSIPQRQRIETENQLVSARNQFESLARQLRLLGIGQEELESMLESQQVSEHYRVLAPIDGIVVGFHQAIGHIVSADEEMFEIHDNSERLVDAMICMWRFYRDCVRSKRSWFRGFRPCRPDLRRFNKGFGDVRSTHSLFTGSSPLGTFSCGRVRLRRALGTCANSSRCFSGFEPSDRDDHDRSSRIGSRGGRVACDSTFGVRDEWIEWCREDSIGIGDWAIDRMG